MNGTDNGTLRPKRPQLSESIEKLDEMIGHLSVAIPGAVGESVREVMGAAFVAAVKEAVKHAVTEALKDVSLTTVASATQTLISEVAPTPVTETPPKPSMWSKVKATLGQLRRWAARVAAPVATHAALGWGLAKLIGSATIRSRVAAFWTAVSGTVAGLVGFAAGPIGASILLGLIAASITASAVWAAPTIRFFASLRNDRL